MPRIARSQKEVDAIREEILDTALQLIIDDGFNNLSMRKIAARLEITATTIYNYVASKDELNLMIRMRGFEMLYRKLEEKYNAHSNLADRLSGMIRAYADFGLSYPNYYDIMFSLTTPKYTDYIGTDIEPTAILEKESSMQCFEIFWRPISEYFTENNLNIENSFIEYTIIKMWSDLHGIISLNNSRVLYEVNENSRSILNKRVEDVILSAIYLKDVFESGMTDD